MEEVGEVWGRNDVCVVKWSAANRLTVRHETTDPSEHPTINTSFASMKNKKKKRAQCPKGGRRARRPTGERTEAHGQEE